VGTTTDSTKTDRRRVKSAQDESRVEKPRTAPECQKALRRATQCQKCEIRKKKMIQSYTQLRKQQPTKVPTKLHQNVLIMAIAKLKV
jgi:hypothetical protein